MDLNRQQKKASEFSTGPSLVIAGAGTGKTGTLVMKVLNILEQGSINENEILLLTFSRKAAAEMKTRLAREICSGERIRVSTFHSLCYSILCSRPDLYMAYSGYSAMPRIIGPEDQETIVKKLISGKKTLFGGLPFQVVMSAINERTVAAKIRDRQIRREIENLCVDYDRHKISVNLIELEEIIDHAVSFLKIHETVRSSFSKRYKYILVDEFQDTSDNNFDLLRLIMNTERNFFAVGDDFQLIYSFRNSRIKYILHLKKYFPGLKTYKLRINYRSRTEIVKISNSFIKKNRFQTAKKLKSAKGKGGLICRIPYHGYENAAGKLAALCSRLEHSGSTAVLYRNNFLEKHLTGVMTEFSSVDFMTIHASKGLEFDNVIIFGIDDSIIPSPWSSLEEERRLFYVAMTRAKERLFMMYSSNDEKPRFISESEF